MRAPAAMSGPEASGSSPGSAPQSCMEAACMGQPRKKAVAGLRARRKLGGAGVTRRRRVASVGQRLGGVEHPLAINYH